MIAACAISMLSGCAAPALMAAGTMAGVVGQAAVGDTMGHHIENRQQRQKATAAAIGPEVGWFSVKVSSVTKRGNLVLWTAETPGGRYDCSEAAGSPDAACTKLPDGRP